jgi:hypothetical protein
MLACVTLALLAASPAAAQESPYCRRVRARAASDASLLMAPRVALQGIRFPQSGQVDVGLTVGNGYQARAALSFSPLDFYKGLGVLDEGAADCAEHEVALEVDGTLREGTDRARLSALQAKIQYLTAHRDEWRAVAALGATRLAEHTITLVEFEELRQRVADLEHRLIQAEGEAAEIDARSPARARSNVGQLAREYLDVADRRERAQAHVRRLDPWQLQVTGGVIPQQPVDWYGLAELSFNLGGFSRSAQETRHAEARMDEVVHAPYEIEARVDRFRSEAEASLDRARRELEAAERDLGVLAGVHEALEKSEAANVAHWRDTIAVEQLAAESEVTFFRALIASLTTLLEDAHV